MKTAIVTGCPGQDASYLSELLLKKDYLVYGIKRRSSTEKNVDNMKNCVDHPNFTSISLDITDASGIRRLICDIKPDEYYNLAAMSHVGQSFEEPFSCLDINGKSVSMALEFIRCESPKTRFYQASTSEMFGGINNIQNERTEFVPRSPYAAAKLYAHNMVDIYRKSYGVFGCCGILFNHESPRRGLDFVTRKITNGIARIKLGIGGPIELGNLEAKRDWGHAKDYVIAMHKMLQQETPADYVIATGTSVSIMEALEHVCKIAGLETKDCYKINKNLIRPLEVVSLCGDYTKAKEELGWSPQCTWQDLLTEMYDNDYYDNCSVLK